MKTKKIFSTIMICSIIFIIYGIGTAHVMINNDNEVVEVTENGNINWSTIQIAAKGYADGNQSDFKQNITAATMARANLIKILQEVQIDSETIVRDGILKGTITTEKVNGLLKHSRVSAPHTNSLGLMEVTASVYLDENNRAILIPDQTFNNTTEKIKPSVLPRGNNKNYSGLILDASGFNVKPAMMPGLYVDDSKWDLLAGNISKEHSLKNGNCGYAGSILKAKQLVDRIGQTPLLVKVKSVSPDGADLYITNDDATSILKAEAKSKILDQCRIVIVVN